jgi:hypothetical protein
VVEVETTKAFEMYQKTTMYYTYLLEAFKEHYKKVDEQGKK